MKYSGRVGAFEGAAYEARGLYRPEADCIMFTRDPVGFLPRVPARHRANHRSLFDEAPAARQPALITARSASRLPQRRHDRQQRRQDREA